MDCLSKVRQTLQNSIEDLKSLEDKWFIIGSAALVLKNIDVGKINDVDILTTKKDAEKLRTLWQHKTFLNYFNEQESLFRSNFCRYKFFPCDIEMMGDLEIKKNAVWEKLIIHEFEEINLGGFKVLIPTLNEQLRIFQLFGRKKDLERAELIYNSKEYARQY